MSYSFGMYFLPVKTLNGALRKAQEFTDLLSNNKNIAKLLEDNRYYFPSSRYCLLKDDEHEKRLLRIADKKAISGFCTLNFVYFHYAKLLGLVGYDYPEVDKYFKKHIGFQNSCDQDYERSNWKGIKCFEQIWDACANADVEELLKHYEGDTAEEIGENLDYYRRSYAYDRIFEMLYLDDWLYDKDNVAFTRFSMSLLTTQEKQYAAERYVDGMRL